MTDLREVTSFDILRQVGVRFPVVAVTWPGELAEAVYKAERARKISRERADKFLTELDVFPISVDDQRLHVTWPAVLAVARRHRLRVGPAATLELAVRARLPLAALDTRLRAAAARAGVALFDPGGG